MKVLTLTVVSKAQSKSGFFVDLNDRPETTNPNEYPLCNNLNLIGGEEFEVGKKYKVTIEEVTE